MQIVSKLKACHATQENLPDAIDGFGEPDAYDSTDLIGVPNAPDTGHATVLAHINNMLEHSHIIVCFLVVNFTVLGVWMGFPCYG